jgi:hypothetical protein
MAGRRLHLALDRRGDLVLVGRVPVAEVSEAELELLLGEAARPTRWRSRR